MTEIIPLNPHQLITEPDRLQPFILASLRSHLTSSAVLLESDAGATQIRVAPNLRTT
jgi:hypothetical protein